jgi:hypothetical protein
MIGRHVQDHVHVIRHQQDKRTKPFLFNLVLLHGSEGLLAHVVFAKMVRSTVLSANRDEEG